MNNILTETTEDGDFTLDIFTKLANDRTFFINNFIDDTIAVDMCASLLLKELEDNTQKISIFINAERGDIRSVFMIYDIMQLLQSPIETICLASAMDEVVILLAAGTKGMRLATENAIIGVSQLIHDKSYYSNLTDAKSVLDRSITDNKDFIKALAKLTGKKTSTIKKDFERRQFLTSKDALKYGIIDGIAKKNK